MRADNAAGVLAPPTKPAGGYRIITPRALAAAWGAYRQRAIRLGDLRAWFAAHEMDARRCRQADDEPRRLGLGELGRLTGLSDRRLTEALRRLRTARLLDWAHDALLFPEPADGPTWFESAACRAAFGMIPNPGRKLPVPRRILRLLARGARPALIATVLGHLIRGLFLKAGRCHERGRVKASWIAEAFGVAPRRVKQARHDLIAAGWIVPLDADQWALNRWGAHYRINLDWAPTNPVGTAKRPIPRRAAPAPRAGLAPPPAPIAPRLAPPDSDEEPLNGKDNNQEPAPGGPAGICHSDLGMDPPGSRTAPPPRAMDVPPAPMPVRPTSAPAPIPGETPSLGNSPPVPGRPVLRDVVPEDLEDTGRLLSLYEQAVRLGLVPSSERDRLRFVAAAEHARAIGTRNPCGLFAQLVRRGLWSFATQDDEDAASARLKRHLYGSRPAERPAAPAPSALPAPRVALSEDARLVQAIRAGLAGKGYRGDPFPLLKRQCPAWTRERWDRASAELQTPPLGLRRPIGGPATGLAAPDPLALIRTDGPPMPGFARSGPAGACRDGSRPRDEGPSREPGPEALAMLAGLKARIGRGAPG